MNTTDNTLKETSVYFILLFLSLFYIGLIIAFFFFSVSLQMCMVNAILAPIFLLVFYKARANSLPPVQITIEGMKTSKGTFIKWEDMNITIISSVKNYEEVFRVRSKNNDEIILTINLENRKKFVELMKTFCPPQHHFFDVAAKYAIKNGYPF